MEIFLVLNGHEINALPSVQEEVILSLAAGEMERDDFREWVRDNIVPLKE